MSIEKIVVSIFVYGFFLLWGFALIEWVDKKPPKKKTFTNLIKAYWSESFLIMCMVVGAYFFIRGIGI